MIEVFQMVRRLKQGGELRIRFRTKDLFNKAC